MNTIDRATFERNLANAIGQLPPGASRRYISHTLHTAYIYPLEALHGYKKGHEIFWELVGKQLTNSTE